MIEDGSGDGRADYLLLDNDQPVMIIEAKRLGLGVSDGRQQAVNYAMDRGRKARYFAVTDGSHWEIYDTHQPAINMLVISFALKEDVSAEVCFKAMALWRPAIKQSSVMAVETPVVGLDTIKRHTEEPIVHPIHQTEPTLNEQPATQKPFGTVSQYGETGPDWVLLSNLYPEKGAKRPSEIQFPDNTRTHIRYWNQVAIESTRWLIQNEMLTERHCPIGFPTRNEFILATSPDHPTRAFHNGKQIGNLHIETNYDTPEQVENTRIIIRHVSQDPAQFKVRF